MKSSYSQPDPAMTGIETQLLAFALIVSYHAIPRNAVTVHEQCEPPGVTLWLWSYEVRAEQWLSI